MGELGRALELMDGALGRYRALEATVCSWHTTLYRSEQRLWFAPPDTLELQGGSARDEGLLHLLEPGRLLGGLRFAVVGRGVHAGREAIELWARRRPGALAEPVLWHLGDDVDELRLAVDAERGVLLRCVAVADGAEWAGNELLAVAFDGASEWDFPTAEPEQCPDLADEPPRARPVSLAEAARLAPFTVLALRMPDPWRLQARWGDAAGGDPAFVTIECRLPDATHRLTILEHAAGAAFADDDSDDVWVTGEHRGVPVEVCEQAPPMETAVRLERDGTLLTLRSSDLTVEQLLRVAGALRRA